MSLNDSTAPKLALASDNTSPANDGAIRKGASTSSTVGWIAMFGLFGLMVYMGWDAPKMLNLRHDLATWMAPATTIVIDTRPALLSQGTQSGPGIGPMFDTRPAVKMPQGNQTGPGIVQQGQPSSDYATPAKKKPQATRKHHRRHHHPKAARSLRPHYDTIFIDGRRYVPAR